MNNTFPPKKSKNNTKAYIVSAVLSIMCIIFTVVFFMKLGKNSAPDTDALVNDNQSSLKVYNALDGARELRGAWIPSVINITFPSKSGLTQKQLENELDEILKTAHKTGLNSLFFQVRPTSDALYDSDIFPASKYVSGTQGVMPENNFDCLKYLLEKSKEYGIEIHAWINPYRVTMYESDEDQLCSTSPAILHPEYTVKYADGKTYFNPGLPEVRELVISGVKELLQKYPSLSGIHYDDYFYPYPSGDAKFDDADAYAKYGGTMSLEDWRRDNVNKLVKETYEAVKSIDQDVRFGVSIFGIWANENSQNTPVKGSKTNGLEAYSSLYCDALSWVKGGYVDYLAPQDYWSFDTSAAPFDNVARWWNAQLDSTGVDLYIGHASYKAGDFKEGEIARQVEFSRSLMSYKGSIFYGFSELKNNVGNTQSTLSELYKNDVFYKDPTPTGESAKINFPIDGSNSPTENTYVIGSSDPAYPLTVDGDPVSRTKGGYFGLFTTLDVGKNTLSLSQNGNTVSQTVNYKNTKASSGYSSTTHRTMDSYEITSCSPSAASWVNVGGSLKLSCAAPSGSVVTATIGGMTVVLQPTINPPDEAEFMYEYYTGSVTPSKFALDNEVKSLGTLIFKAEKGEHSAEKKVGLISQAGKDAYYYVEVKDDYTHTKVGTKSSFYDDFLPSSAGMRDYVTAFTDGFYKLRFGGYIEEDKVSLNFGRKLTLNKLTTATVEVVSEDTSNNDCNTTDIRLGITENIPVDVDFREGFMRLIIYNTDTSFIPEFEIAPNPLIESINGEPASKENMLIYRVKLKDDKNFYGFNIVYDGAVLVFKLNNPQTLHSSKTKPLTGKTIVVDAGHGGSDIGAPGPGKTPEAVLNYEIASRLAVNLRELGAEVIETRERNQTCSLYERMDILNDTCPDLAISVHHNSVASSANAQKTRGFVSLYSNNSGVLLSEIVSKTVCRQLNRQERKSYYEQLAVARNHRFPSTLVEMCFISNAEEYQWSITTGNYDRSAKALTQGILDYYKAQEVYLEY